MLVLSRKQFETIRIGNDIEITVCRLDGNKVRLGITAPDHVAIARGELEPEEGGESHGRTREAVRRVRG